MEQISSQSGISLIQLAIAILIASIGLSAAAKLATMQFYKDQEEEITQSFEDINELFLAYYTGVDKDGNPNRRLPCPARRDLAIDHPDFGKEACGSVTIQDGALTHPDTGNPLRVMIGALPVKELTLSTEDAFDVFGGQFLYAVSEAMTSNSNYGRNDLASIQRINTDGNVIGQPLPFIVISAGETGRGAYSVSGTLIESCPASGNERENCDDDDARFLDTDISERTGLTTFFDDRVGYDGNFASRVANTIISNLTCPTGQVLTGVQEGHPNCEVIEENVPSCPAGQHVTSIINGQPICSAQSVSPCPNGQYLRAITNGQPVCQTLPQPPPTNIARCPTGQVLVGISNGNPVCRTDQDTTIGNLSCPRDHVLVGINNGRPVCQQQAMNCKDAHLNGRDCGVTSPMALWVCSGGKLVCGVCAGNRCYRNGK